MWLYGIMQILPIGVLEPASSTLTFIIDMTSQQFSTRISHPSNSHHLPTQKCIQLWCYVHYICKNPADIRYYLFNPICISICTVNSRYSLYVLYWNTTRSNQWKRYYTCLLYCSTKNCNTSRNTTNGLINAHLYNWSTSPYYWVNGSYHKINN